MTVGVFFYAFLFLSSQSSFQSRHAGRLLHTWEETSFKRASSATVEAKNSPIADTSSRIRSWDEMFHFLLLYRDREGNCNVPGNHRENGINLGAWLSRQRNLGKNGKLIPTRRKSLEEAGVVWNIDLWKWNQTYDLLLKYKAREGHCDVPQLHQEEGVNLGRWLDNQRTAMKLGKLDKNRTERLDAAGVSYLTRDESWDSSYSLLLNFKGREGHCDVPKRHQEEGVNLGQWLANQRQAMRLGTLDENRKKQLETVGVSFDPHRDKWELLYSLLLDFKEREGHCNVPQLHQVEGMSLGLWLNNQRHAMKFGKLSKDRKELLEKAGVSFDLNRDKWDLACALLLDFKESEGHCDVPQQHQVEGVNLGAWLNNQRHALKVGNLDKTRREQLKRVGVTFDVHGEKWESMYELLLQYKSRYGNCNHVPVRYVVEGKYLGRWLAAQRQAYGRGQLRKEREERLRQVGISWYLFDVK